MLATCEDAMAGIMTFASLTDAVALTVEQWIPQHSAFIVKTFFYKQ
jgi:hypothetical protein